MSSARTEGARRVVAGLTDSQRQDLLAIASCVVDICEAYSLRRVELTWAVRTGQIHSRIVAPTLDVIASWPCSGATALLFTRLALEGLAELLPNVQGWPAAAMTSEDALAVLDAAPESSPSPDMDV